jgi:Glycosyl transferases group 1
MRVFYAQPVGDRLPLRIGSGTRLKILEAFAMRKAVVSNSLGCEGLDVIPGKHLIVADQPEAFARQVALIFPGAPLAGSPQARIMFIGFYIVV